jgi:hypothetical protein
MKTCELRESKVARAMKSLSRIPLAIHSAVPDNQERGARELLRCGDLMFPLR